MRTARRSQLIRAHILRCLCLLLLLAHVNCRQEGISPKSIPDILSHRSLGLAYLEEGSWPNAESEFKKIIELAPDEALGHANLALTYLRMSKPEEAQKAIQKALQLSDAPEVRLIQAEILDRNNNGTEAIAELEKSVAKSPWHIQSHYKLVQLYMRAPSPANSAKIEGHLQQIVEKVPANLPARLRFVETLLQNNNPIDAAAQLQEIRKQIPELPADSASYLEKALTLIQSGQTRDAFSSAVAFHNILKQMPIYRQGITELSGPGGAQIGFPLVR